MASPSSHDRDVDGPMDLPARWRKPWARNPRVLDFPSPKQEQFGLFLIWAPGTETLSHRKPAGTWISFHSSPFVVATWTIQRFFRLRHADFADLTTSPNQPGPGPSAAKGARIPSKPPKTAKRHATLAYASRPGVETLTGQCGQKGRRWPRAFAQKFVWRDCYVNMS